jgi:hypothetical protein
MKRVRLSCFFAGLFLSGSFAFGQQTQPWQGTDASVIAGHFEMNKRNEQRNITEHINVNYSISPMPFSKTLKLELSTALPTLFSADIVDARGQKVKHWVPQAKSYRYEETLDISSLPVGEYSLNIYSELGTTMQHRISFRKEKTN